MDMDLLMTAYSIRWSFRSNV